MIFTLNQKINVRKVQITLFLFQLCRQHPPLSPDWRFYLHRWVRKSRQNPQLGRRARFAKWISGVRTAAGATSGRVLVQTPKKTGMFSKFLLAEPAAEPRGSVAGRGNGSEPRKTFCFLDWVAGFSRAVNFCQMLQRQTTLWHLSQSPNSFRKFFYILF